MQVSRSLVILALFGKFRSAPRYYRAEPASVHPRQGCYGESTMAVRHCHTSGAAGITRCGPGVRSARPHCTIFLVRSEGLEPPRCYSLPPQGSASTNSATSAWEIGTELAPDRINGRRCNKSGMEGQGPLASWLS